MALIDDLIKHQMLLQRIVNRYVSLRRDVIQEIQDKFAKDRKQINFLLTQNTVKVLRELNKLMVYETKFIQERLSKYSGIKTNAPELPQIQDTSLAFNTRKETVNVEKAFDKIDEYSAKRILASEEDTSLINSDVLARYGSLITTAVNHTANVAREETYAVNEDVVDSIEWIAILDENTCPDCEDLNYTEFKIGEVEEDCPLHANCRCELVPIVNGVKFEEL